MIDDGQQVASLSAATVEAGDFAGGTTYATRGARDQTCGSSEPLSSGSSIAQILNNANVSVPSGGSVDIEAAGVPEIDLSAVAVGSKGAQQFYGGQLPIVYGNGATQLSFIRGLYATPAPCPPEGPESGADSNTGSSGEIFDAGEIDIVVRSGPVLDVSVVPDPQTSCTAGASCELRAVVSGDASATYAYSWDFGDGSSVMTSKPSVVHTYSDPNSDYFPQVTVDGSDGSHGVGYGDVELPTAVQTSTSPSPSGPVGVSSQSITPPPSSSPSSSTARATSSAPATTSATAPTSTASATNSGSAAPVSSDTHRTVGSHSRSDQISGRLVGDEQSLTPVVIDPANAATSKQSVAVEQGDSGLSIAFGIMVVLLLVSAGAGREWHDRHRSK